MLQSNGIPSLLTSHPALQLHPPSLPLPFVSHVQLWWTGTAKITITAIILTVITTINVINVITTCSQRYLPEVGVGTLDRSGALLRRTTGLWAGEARSPAASRRDTLGLVDVGLVGLELWVGLLLLSSSATPLSKPGQSVKLST